MIGEKYEKIDKVIPCVCGTMPVLHVRNCGNRKQEYGAQCPKCGRGMETGAGKTNWSAYSALKEWNEMQLGLHGEKHEK